MIDFTKIKNFKKGLYVKVKSPDGAEHNGYIEEILSKKNSKDGIRVVISSSLTNSLTEGIVVDVPSKNDVQKEVFKYYNLFFSNKEFYSLIDKEGKLYTFKVSKQKISEVVVTLFSDPQKGKDFLLKMNLEGFSMKRISKKNMLQNNFNSIDYNYYLIDGTKLVQKNKFDELEKYFLMHQ